MRTIAPLPMLLLLGCAGTVNGGGIAATATPIHASSQPESRESRPADTHRAAAHFDGKSWTMATLPFVLGKLNDVSGFAANDVWAAGSGGLLHYGGP